MSEIEQSAERLPAKADCNAHAEEIVDHCWNVVHQSPLHAGQPARDEAEPTARSIEVNAGCGAAGTTLRGAHGTPSIAGMMVP